MSDAYEMIDGFLRNNLEDDDYAEFSAALDSVAKAGEALAERDALQVDADRYRWLRTCENDYMVLVGDVHHCQLLMEDQLDAAVDAAMEGKS